METQSIDIDKILMERLEKKGIESNLIPRFLKDLINSSFLDPYISLSEVNDKLHSLGWDDIQLDFHTFQLTKEVVERSNLKGREA